MFTNVEDALVGLVRRFAADCGDIDEWEYADLVEAVAEDSSPTVAAELRKRFFYPDITVDTVSEVYPMTADGPRFVRVREDDGTIQLTALTNDRAELICSEVTVSGAATSPAALATIIEAML